MPPIEKKKIEYSLIALPIIIQVIPIISCLDIYAQEKARLRKAGMPVDEFDLLIGCSALANGMTLVGNNFRHFQSITDIELENWTV